MRVSKHLFYRLPPTEALTLALGFQTEHVRISLSPAMRADTASAAVSNRPALAKSTTLITRQNALHIAAEQGHLHVLASILEALCISATTPHAADEPDDGPQASGRRWHLQAWSLCLCVEAWLMLMPARARPSVCRRRR